MVGAIVFGMVVLNLNPNQLKLHPPTHLTYISKVYSLWYQTRSAKGTSRIGVDTNCFSHILEYEKYAQPLLIIIIYLLKSNPTVKKMNSTIFTGRARRV